MEFSLVFSVRFLSNPFRFTATTNTTDSKSEFCFERGGGGMLRFLD
jgi:hypothetical protein